MKLTVCITAQYKNVTMMGFKVKEGAENMSTPSTVGSFKPNSKEITDSLKLASNFPIESTIQERTRETAKLAIKLLPSFLTWEIFIIFQVVVVA